MHDGRFRNIDDVLDHYANGIQSSPTLHPSLEGGIQLTSLERSHIKSFLHTLTDYEMMGDMEINEQ
jgi:cytochrome c peroxidase